MSRLSPHGTSARYKHGCRCNPCREAHSTYQREWRQAKRQKTANPEPAASVGWSKPKGKPGTRARKNWQEEQPGWAWKQRREIPVNEQVCYFCDRRPLDDYPAKDKPLSPLICRGCDRRYSKLGWLRIAA